MAESEEKVKSLLIKMKEESEKAGLNKINIQNHDHGLQSHHLTDVIHMENNLKKKNS